MAIFVRSRDGRQLAVNMSGHPTGQPVFMLHGTPGSRVGPFPKSRVLYELGVRLISFDRPGYGGSDRLVSRRVGDVAPDVVAIADHLGIDRFAVLGRSGGGPHALACAALLPDRVTRAGVLVSLAPWAAEGLDWFAGMSDSTAREYTAAASEPELLTARLVETAAQIKANPAGHVAVLRPEMPDADRRVVSDVGIRALLAKNFAEALRDSADGWIDDALAFCSPWGFNLADITVPVLLWHGENDVFSPVAHARWLADQIPHAIMSIRPGAAHLSSLEVMPDVLSWLIRPDVTETSGSRPLMVQEQVSPGARPEHKQAERPPGSADHGPIGPASPAAGEAPDRQADRAEGQPQSRPAPFLTEQGRGGGSPPGIPTSRGVSGRPDWRALTRSFTDGVGGTFDIFGAIGRRPSRLPSRLPSFEDALAEDARELCRLLGLPIHTASDSDEERGR